MRAIPFLLLAAALTLAGCASDDDDGTGTTTPTPMTPTPDDSGNTTDDGNATDEPSENETVDDTPTEPTPKEVVNHTFDYASGGAAGPDGHVFTFDVPAGYKDLTLIIKGEGGDQADLPTTGLGVNQKLTILDPDGAEVFSLAPGADTDEERVVTAAAGKWTLKYEGTANVKVLAAGTVSGAAATPAADDAEPEA